MKDSVNGKYAPTIHFNIAFLKKSLIMHQTCCFLEKFFTPNRKIFFEKSFFESNL